MKNVIEGLDRVKVLLSERRGLSEIERDMALEILRNAYTEVKFGTEIKFSPAAPPNIDIEPAAAAAKETTRPAAIDIEAEQEALIGLIYDKTEAASCGRPEAEKAPEEAPEVPAEPTVEEEKELIDLMGEKLDVACDVEPDGEEAPSCQAHPAELATAEAEKEALPTAEKNPSLFETDTIPVRQSEDRRVILSLYGDGQEDKHDKPTKVLGESINNDRHTIGDVLKEGHTDLAAKISAETITTLRGAIGINDRFLMIRDLFDGDSVRYEAAIDRLETFDDLDDAMIYIGENYSWNPDGDATGMLVDLLTRKLS